MSIQNPSDIIRFIEGNSALSALVAERNDPADLFEAIRKQVAQVDFLPMLRGMAIIAISTALDGEKRRIRKAVKEGRDVETKFTWLLESEIQWDQRLADLDSEAMRNLARRLSGVLGAWIMDNGRPLGLATAGYVRSVASREEHLSAGHIRNRDFYLRIAGDLPDDAIIGDHISPVEAEAARKAIFDDRIPAQRMAA